mgnify:CR=1 FL=1
MVTKKNNPKNTIFEIYENLTKNLIGKNLAQKTEHFTGKNWKKPMTETTIFNKAT